MGERATFESLKAGGVAEGPVVERTLTTGETIAFRVATRPGQFEQVQARAAELHAALQTPPEGMEAYSDLTETEVMRAVALSRFLTEPAMEDEGQALELTLTNGWLVKEIDDEMGRAAEPYRVRRLASLEDRKRRILKDAEWRMRLTLARDVYHKHPLELTPEQDYHLLDLAALKWVENEEAEEEIEAGRMAA